MRVRGRVRVRADSRDAQFLEVAAAFEEVADSVNGPSQLVRCNIPARGVLGVGQKKTFLFKSLRLNV